MTKSIKIKSAVTALFALTFIVNAAPTPQIKAVSAIAGPEGIVAYGSFDDRVHARLSGILLDCIYMHQEDAAYEDFLTCSSARNEIIRQILVIASAGEAITSRLELYYDNPDIDDNLEVTDGSLEAKHPPQFYSEIDVVFAAHDGSGQQGPQGEQGPAGPQGDKGDTGEMPNLSYMLKFSRTIKAKNSFSAECPPSHPQDTIQWIVTGGGAVCPGGSALNVSKPLGDSSISKGWTAICQDGTNLTILPTDTFAICSQISTRPQ